VVVSPIIAPPAHAASHATAGVDNLGDEIGGYIEIGGADDASTALSGTFATGATVTFTKPASWISYKIMAWGTFHFTSEFDAPSIGTGEAKILIDGNSGGVVALTSPQPENRDEPFTISVRHLRTGLTASAVCEIQGRAALGTLNGQGSNIQYLAVRTS
jgi:hypothetical protein